MRANFSVRQLSRWVWIASVLIAGLAARQDLAADSGSPRTQSLDGPWRIAFDPKDVGRAEGWFQPGKFPVDASRPIPVPGSLHDVDPSYSGVFWYSRTFTPELARGPGLRQVLRFGAVSYACEVWLNGTLLGSHEGAQSPFEFDVTETLLPDQPNEVSVQVTLTLRITGPFLVTAGGINQHVTLATQPTVRIRDVFAKPDIHTGKMALEIALENRGSQPATVALRAAYGQFKPRKELGLVTGSATVAPGSAVSTLGITIDQPRLWSPDDPFLYTLEVTSDWAEAPAPKEGRDRCAFRTGFRDFRIVDGFFYLNGKRFYPKSLHGNFFDPIWMYGTPRDMTYLSQDFPLLKQAGFNMYRFLLCGVLPEQLDQADEMGFLIYSEHETSWLQKPETKHGITLADLVRRDRNHPSLVIWGLLNETEPGRFYEEAKGWLPGLRTIDDTRLMLLNSGRWDKDLKTGSASNPGSTTWDVFLGGEDPTNPTLLDQFVKILGGGYRSGTGDIHVYQAYPTTWEFIEVMAQFARNTKPVFVSEGGLGSSYNAFRVERKLRAAGAPEYACAWEWVRAAIAGLQKTWPKYQLETLYPSIESMLIDSELNAARQRELMFTILRSNPKITGYSLTSQLDCVGNAEGIMDVFREFKPGHLPVLQAGWAKLRWCLLVNPMHGYAEEPFRIRVALASEDALAAGVYPATLRISGPSGVLWEKRTSITVPAGPTPPLAYPVCDEDVTIAGLAAGSYTLTATLDDRANAASSELAFFVSEKRSLPRNLGTLTMLGVSPALQKFLQAHGATLREYRPEAALDREVIVVGEEMPGTAAAWRALYARIARGAHGVFLAPSVFNLNKTPNQWLALASKGKQTGNDDWLYHKDVLAKVHPFTAGLQTKIMTPDYYAELLTDTRYFRDVPVPDDPAAVAIRCTYAPFQYTDGVMLGSYRHHAGRFTIQAFRILKTLGHPATDRLLLNILTHAATTAAPVAAIPEGYEAELDTLGIQDPK